MRLLEDIIFLLKLGYSYSEISKSSFASHRVNLKHPVESWDLRVSGYLVLGLRLGMSSLLGFGLDQNQYPDSDSA